MLLSHHFASWWMLALRRFAISEAAFTNIPNLVLVSNLPCDMEEWKLSGHLILSLRQYQGAPVHVDDHLKLAVKDKTPSFERLDG